MIDPESEIINIRRHHIEDMRALVGQFEQERTEWAEAIQQATARECGALCGDIERDREELAREIEQLRTAGLAGVVHETDLAQFRSQVQAMAADRDRFADLHRNLAARQRALIGEWRARQYAARLVGEAETMLSVALGRPGAVNRDNLVGALAELVKERDALLHSESLDAVKAGSDEQILRNVVNVQKRTIDTQVEDLATKQRTIDSLQRAVDSSQRQLNVRVKELGAAAERYRTAEGQVDRGVAEAHEREAELRNANTILLQQGIDLDVFRERAEQAEEKLEDACGVIERQREDLELLHGRNEEIERAAVEVERQLREERARYAGLQSASQAVGEQLTRAIGLADRARRRRVADTELLHTAHGIIANAEDNKLRLPCLDAHCVEGDHTRDMDNPQPIGDPEWKKAARRWSVEFHAREAAAGAVPNPTEDPLSEFTVRPVTNGQFQWVYVEHAAGGPHCDLTYPQSLPGDVALLSQIVHDAYLHVTQRHNPPALAGADEASPDDAEDPCDAICHPEHGACCGKVKEPPTEVNE